MKKITTLIITMLLVLSPALLWAAPQPYMPQAGDLQDKDRPNAATVRQVQNRSENFKPMPQRPSNTPVRPPQEQRFQPRPYIPDPAETPTTTATRPVSPPVVVSTPATLPEHIDQPSAAISPPPAITVSPGAEDPKPLPVAGEPAVPVSGNAQEEVKAVVGKALAAYSAHDCAGLLAVFHGQAYVLVRNPWGEQGSLGHQQLREAYCADINAQTAATIQVKNKRVEMVSAERAKAWGELSARWTHKGEPVEMPASFEADLVKEGGRWLITDAIIQYDTP